MSHEINVLAVGDGVIEAECDAFRGWCGRFAERYAKEHDAELNFRNRGLSGETSLALLKKLDSELQAGSRWDLVIVGIGVNDCRKIGPFPLKYEVDTNQFRDNVQRICERLGSLDEGVLCIFSGIVPVIEELTTPFTNEEYYFDADCVHYQNIIEEEVGKRERFGFVNFRRKWYRMNLGKRLRLMPDGLNPNKDGYEYLAEMAWDIYKNDFILQD
jgi:lysophospholipase L1-like esterase